VTTVEPKGPQTFEYHPRAGVAPLMSWFERIDSLIAAAPYHYSTAAQGFAMLTSLEGIRDVMQHPDAFSNSSVDPTEPNPPYLWIPEMLDPPVHTKWRQLLAPYFSPARIADMEEGVRALARKLVDEIAPKGRCDFTADFAGVYPIQIFLELMGLPVEDAPRFLVWEDHILNPDPETDPDQSRSYQAMQDVMAYFSELFERRRAEPADDLVSAALSWRIDGEPIPDADLLSMCLLMFMAGLDTVTAQLSWTYYHLAANPSDRERLVRDPALIPDAVEESLRFYTIVTPSRKVMRDTVVAGCPLKPGEMVYLPLAAACRDPRGFDDADRFILDRSPNNHIAFGAGAHRCVGSHLARRELRVALEEWHKRIPVYRIAEGTEPATRLGGQRTCIDLVLTWDV